MELENYSTIENNQLEDVDVLGNILETLKEDNQQTEISHCQHDGKRFLQERSDEGGAIFPECAMNTLETMLQPSHSPQIGNSHCHTNYTADHSGQSAPGSKQLDYSPNSTDSGFSGSETLSPGNQRCIHLESSPPGYQYNGQKLDIVRRASPIYGMNNIDTWMSQLGRVSPNCIPAFDQANGNTCQSFPMSIPVSTSNMIPGYIQNTNQNQQSMPQLSTPLQNYDSSILVRPEFEDLPGAKPPKSKTTKRGARPKRTSNRSQTPPGTKMTSAKERQKVSSSRRKRTKSETEDGIVENVEQAIQTDRITEGVREEACGPGQNETLSIAAVREHTVTMPILNLEPMLPTDTIRPNNYISGFFDHTGGHLILRELGVNMFIPPGAIPRGRRQEIFMYLSWENKHQPIRDEQKTQIGPVIVCGPNGLKFEENVCLNFKHCIDPKDDWNVSAIYTATDIDEHSQYQLLIDPTKEDEQGALCLLDNEMCTILVDHFTGFGLQGEPETRKPKGEEGETVVKQYMYSMVYMAMHQQDIQLRVYVVKQIAGAEQWVEDEENKIMCGGRKCEMTKPLALKGNKNDVVVTIQNITNGWKLFPNDKTERLLSFDTLWETGKHGCSYTLELDDLSEKSSPFRCSILVTQLENDEENTAEFTISQDHLESSFVMPSKVVEKTSLPRDVRLEMCYRLDREHPLGFDWRRFAEFLGLSRYIQQFEAQARFKSPTQSLLTIWECRKGVPKAEDVIALHDFFRSIEREDVALSLRGHIEITYGNIDMLRSKNLSSPADSGYSGSPRFTPRSVDSSGVATPKKKTKSE